MRLRSRIAASALTVLACDGAAGPSDVGGLALQLESTPSNVAALTGGRVFVNGPTTKDQDATPGTTVTVTGLRPGRYSVALEGLIQDEVDQFGQVGGVDVEAGRNTPITMPFAAFRPSLVALPESVMGTRFTVTYSSLSDAKKYVVEVANDGSFTTIASTEANPTQSSVDIGVPTYGQYFVRVRAIDPYDARGRPSNVESTRSVCSTSGGGLHGSVEVGNNFFRSKQNGSCNVGIDTVSAGQVVTWTWTNTGTTGHSVESTGSPTFSSSEVLTGNGQTHSFAFTTPGTYSYQCGVHGAAMSGRVIVE